VTEQNETTNIISFKRSSDLSEELRRANFMDRKGRCQHSGVKIVDEKERTVECEQCKAVLDPVMCLLEIANEWRSTHGPRLRAIREYMKERRQRGEDFEAWWKRIGNGRSYRTNKEAAEEAFWAASTPDLKLCTKLIAREGAIPTDGERDQQ
jgi:hypothetical protein